MSNRPNHIYLVMDAGSPVAAFTLKDEMRTYLQRRQDSFMNPLVYTFGGELHAGHHDDVAGVGGMRARRILTNITDWVKVGACEARSRSRTRP
jgi:hypothetical protein